MISWRLWSALQNPPALHPLFQRTAAVEYALNWQLPGHSFLARVPQSIYVLLTVIAFFISPQIVLGLVILVPISMAFFVIVFPVLLLLWMNLLGMFWTSVISTTITKEHECRTYDLLCLLPDGMFGTNWALCSGCLHRGAVFGTLFVTVRIVWGLGLLVLGIMLIVILGLVIEARILDNGQDYLQALRTLTDTIALIVGYYVHYIQLVVLSPLVGVVTAFYVRNRLEARLIAPVIFLVLQIASFAISLLVSIQILPVFYGNFLLNNPLIYLSQPIVYLLVFYVIREAHIFILWSLVRQQLNAHPSEFRTLASLPQ